MKKVKKLFPLLFCLGLLHGCNQAASPTAAEEVSAVIQFVNAKYDPSIKQLTQIDPAYLFIYANHLFNLGQKDAAVFWFYVAQYRGMIISIMDKQTHLLTPERYQQLAADAGTPVIGQMIVLGPGVSREQLYTYIHSGLGIEINGYAGTDIENWIAQLEKVLAFEKANPFDPFQAVPADSLDKTKQTQAFRQAQGLTELVRFLKEQTQK